MAAPVYSALSLRVAHVGSLVRPEELVQASQAFDADQGSKEALAQAEDAAIASVVKQQLKLGLSTFNDGELRRKIYFDGVFDKLQGMTHLANRPTVNPKGYVPWIEAMRALGMKEYDTFFATGKISRVRPWFVDQFKFLKSLVSPEDVKKIKLTICSPTWFHQRHESGFAYDRSIYPSDDAYFDDIAAAYRAEIKELYELGCRNIQIDDSIFCFTCSNQMIRDMEAAGIDCEALLDLYMGAINKCIDGRPRDLVVGLHVCRGNLMGAGFCEGGYDRIAPKLFNNLNVDAYYLEYDSPLCGDFNPLKHLPAGKKLFLGVVSTRSHEVETVEYLCSRVREAAKAMVNPSRTEEQAMNQLAISPQCGFAPVAALHVLSEQAQWEKLEVMVNAAKALWPQ